MSDFSPLLRICILPILFIISCSASSSTSETNTTASTLLIGSVEGTFQSLLGVNGGPLSLSTGIDVTQAYQDSGVTQVRTHDFYGPMDMATLYPDQNPEANPREPTNKANWIEAAVFIIQHYNDAAIWGTSPLQYVEIWNEPNNEIFWDGADEAFYDFFADVAYRLNVDDSSDTPVEQNQSSLEISIAGGTVQLLLLAH